MLFVFSKKFDKDADGQGCECFDNSGQHHPPLISDCKPQMSDKIQSGALDAIQVVEHMQAFSTAPSFSALPAVFTDSTHLKEAAALSSTLLQVGQELVVSGEPGEGRQEASKVRCCFPPRGGGQFFFVPFVGRALLYCCQGGHLFTTVHTCGD